MLAGDAIDVEARVEVPCPRCAAAAAAPNPPRFSSFLDAAGAVVGIRSLAGEAALGGVGLVHVEDAVV